MSYNLQIIGAILMSVLILTSGSHSDENELTFPLFPPAAVLSLDISVSNATWIWEGTTQMGKGSIAIRENRWFENYLVV